MISIVEILDRLRVARKNCKMKQEDLAQKLNLERTTYVRKEKGTIPIITEEWIAISEALDTDLSYFFNKRGEATDIEISSTGEKSLLKLYRSLNSEERQNLRSGIRLLCAGINTNKVQDILRAF